MLAKQLRLNPKQNHVTDTKYVLKKRNFELLPADVTDPNT